MAKTPTTTQAMPHDGRKGAPDGVNDQGEEVARKADKARRKRAAAGKQGDEGVGGGFLDHGGQSGMGYHGTGQLGEKDVKPGGNHNAGAKSK